MTVRAKIVDWTTEKDWKSKPVYEYKDKAGDLCRVPAAEHIMLSPFDLGRWHKIEIQDGVAKSRKTRVDIALYCVVFLWFVAFCVLPCVLPYEIGTIVVVGSILVCGIGLMWINGRDKRKVRRSAPYALKVTGVVVGYRQSSQSASDSRYKPTTFFPIIKYRYNDSRLGVVWLYHEDTRAELPVHEGSERQIYIDEKNYLIFTDSDIKPGMPLGTRIGIAAVVLPFTAIAIMMLIPQDILQKTTDEGLWGHSLVEVVVGGMAALVLGGLLLVSISTLARSIGHLVVVCRIIRENEPIIASFESRNYFSGSTVCKYRYYSGGQERFYQVVAPRSSDGTITIYTDGHNVYSKIDKNKAIGDLCGQLVILTFLVVTGLMIMNAIL